MIVSQPSRQIFSPRYSHRIIAKILASGFNTICCDLRLVNWYSLYRSMLINTCAYILIKSLVIPFYWLFILPRVFLFKFIHPLLLFLLNDQFLIVLVTRMFPYTLSSLKVEVINLLLRWLAKLPIGWNRSF